jgi:hypothetical protein
MNGLENINKYLRVPSQIGLRLEFCVYLHLKPES